MELEVPADLYGLTIAEPTMLDRRLDGVPVFLFELARIYGMLAANYVVILLFLAQLWKMNASRRMSQCSGDLLPLELGCVFIFQVRMLSDLRKGLSILALLWSLKTSKPMPKNGSYANLTSSKPHMGAVLVDEEHGLLGRLRNTLGKSTRHDPSKQWKLQEVSLAYRAVCATVVALPKVLLDLTLAYMGGVYVMRSETDSDMVLNTLAVVFIAEIPQLMYTAFTSQAMRYSLEGLQAVKVELSNRQRLARWFAGCVLAPLFTVCASWLVVAQTREEDCPGNVFSVALFRDALHAFRQVRGAPSPLGGLRR